MVLASPLVDDKKRGRTLRSDINLVIQKLHMLIFLLTSSLIISNFSLLTIDIITLSIKDNISDIATQKVLLETMSIRNGLIFVTERTRKACGFAARACIPRLSVVVDAKYI